MTAYFVRPTTERPDFRLIIAFLWGDLHDVDTEGDADHPASRDWTELYCMNRENKAEVFEIFPVRTDPLVLRVESELPYLAARAAYVLAKETGSGWAEQAEAPFADAALLVPVMGSGFDLDAAHQRVARSRWR